MGISESSKVGRRGTFVIPASLRRRYGLEEGSQVVAEETPEDILIRPAVTVPIELYSRERQAEFLLSNAIDADDYAHAVKAVEEMGLDADTIPHMKPEG